MNRDCLRTGDKASVHFRFIKTPEYLHCDQKLVFREGRTKAVGTITKVLEPTIMSVFQCRTGSFNINNTHLCKSADTGCVCVFSFSNQWTPRQLRPSRPRCWASRRLLKKAWEPMRRRDQQHGRRVLTQHSYRWVNPHSVSIYSVFQVRHFLFVSEMRLQDTSKSVKSEKWSLCRAVKVRNPKSGWHRRCPRLKHLIKAGPSVSAVHGLYMKTGNNTSTGILWVKGYTKHNCRRS